MENAPVAGTRKPNGSGRGFVARGLEQRGEPSRLATWPSPFRSGADKPKITRYIADEERDRPEPPTTGFRITRGLLVRRDE
jgi:hypothetical protein